MIVISGAMVASLALPASALTPTVSAKTTAPVAVAVASAAPSAAQAPLAPRTFGNIGFTGVVKPKPKPVVIARPRTEVTVSRSNTRNAISPTSTKQEAPAASPSSGGVLGIAAQYAGIYYVYGGTTPAGFDCSGYTQYVFNKVGINLPRTAEQQRQSVKIVSNPQPGDLVFVGAPASHVGIYAGNGMMWDSPHTGSAISKRDIWASNPTYGRP